MDFMATFFEVGNAEYPDTFNGTQITPMQGKSMKPIFEGQKREGHPILFNEHEGGRYVRSTDWKLVTLDAKSPWELYSINEDRTETVNVADQNPEIVAQLDSLWQQWALANHVLPKPQ
jgi:arylsulfatase